METVREKIAYLRGMIDGGDAIKDDTQRVIWQRMMNILEDLSDEIEDLALDQEEIEEYIESVDEALTELEEDYYDNDEFETVEMECPNCHKHVCFEEDFLYDDEVEVSCPDCGAVVFETDEVDDDVVYVDGDDEEV